VRTGHVIIRLHNKSSNRKAALNGDDIWGVYLTMRTMFVYDFFKKIGSDTMFSCNEFRDKTTMAGRSEKCRKDANAPTLPTGFDSGAMWAPHTPGNGGM
jgi:hypothetical protein